MMSIYQPIMQNIHVYSLHEDISMNDVANWFKDNKIAILSNIEITKTRDLRIQIAYFLHSEYANQFMCDIEIHTCLGNPLIYNIINKDNEFMPIKMLLCK